MSTADKLDDSWPYTHGTVDGYDLGGCRGGSCPAGAEHGLSCKLAKSLSRNDYRYSRLVKTGATVAEIAAQFDLVGTSAASATPATQAKAATKTEPTRTAKAEKAATAPSAPAAPVASPAPTLADVFAGVIADEPTAAEIREWAIARGYELASHGRIPRHIREHFDQARHIAPAKPADEPQPADKTPAAVEPDALAAAREIREFIGPMRHEDGTLNASAVAQESTLRAEAGLKGWIAELDAPRDAPTHHDSDVAAVAQPARPEWGYVALQEDLQHATTATATALEERDRARDLAARLFDELHRVETTAAEHRERSAAALADYLRDLGAAEQALHDAQHALAAAAEGRRIAESALQLALRKWGELRAENNTLRAYPSLIGGLLR